MKFRTFRQFWHRWLAVAALFGGLACARSAESFQLFRTTLTIPERGEVTGYAVVTPGRKITFLPAPGWTAVANPERREVVLTKGDLETAASFRLLPKPPPAAEDAKVDEKEKTDRLKERATNQFPDSEVIREFACFVDGQKGMAFDLERRIDGDVKLVVRAAYVDLPADQVEFQLTTTPKKAGDMYFEFGCLMASFHVVPLEKPSGEAPPALPKP